MRRDVLPSHEPVSNTQTLRSHRFRCELVQQRGDGAVSSLQGGCWTIFKPALSLHCCRAPGAAQAQPNVSRSVYAASAGMGLRGLSKNNLVLWGTGNDSSEGEGLIKELISKSAAFFLRNKNYLEMSTLRKPEASVTPSSALQLCITAAISKVPGTKTNWNKVYRLYMHQTATKLNYHCS